MSDGARFCCDACGKSYPWKHEIMDEDTYLIFTFDKGPENPANPVGPDGRYK